MTEKSNCVFTLQSLLNERFTTIFASGTNLYAAQTFQDLVLTANSLNDGYWAQIHSFYDPLTPAFQCAVRTLNDSITNGTTKPANFAAYVKLLAAALQA